MLSKHIHGGPAGAARGCAPPPARARATRGASVHAATASAEAAAAGPQSDPSFASLARWIEASGGHVRGLDLRPCRMGPAFVRGLVAAAPAPSGASLLAVPLSRALRDDAVPEAYPGAPWAASMAAFLVAEAEKGTASDWAPYIASLPGDLTSGGGGGGGGGDAGMLALSDAQVEEVQYAPAVAALAAFRAQSRRAYDDWRRAGSATAAGCSWERFALALHLVQSRTIRLAITGCRVMIPAVDCLNHGGSAGASGTLALGSSSWSLGDERTINYVITRDVAAGEQVLWTYGDRSSCDFFCYHGFVLPGNAQEEVQLWGSVAELAEWFCREHGLDDAGGRLRGAAEAAAQQAAQLAAIACSSPHVPGTCSFLMAPLDLAAAGGSGGAAPALAGGQGRLEGWLQALKQQGRGVERRLASLRLHLPEWGTDACAAVPPELVARGDGCCDVRLAAALVALCDAGAAGAAAGREGPARLVARRARQLLAGFPTSADSDRALLAAGGAQGSMYEVVAYRLAKKEVLQRLAAV